MKRLVPLLLSMISACNTPSPGASNDAPTAPASQSAAPERLAPEPCEHGSCEAEVIVEGQGRMRGLALHDGRLFWSTSGEILATTAEIRTAGASGGSVHTLVSGIAAVCSLAVGGDHLYYTEFVRPHHAPDQLRRVRIDGGKSEVLAESRSACMLAIAARDVVWVTHMGVHAVPHKGGAARVIASRDRDGRVGSFGNSIFWTSVDGVWRLEGTKSSRVLPSTDIGELAVTREHLVIARAGRDPALVRARHDGSDARTLYSGPIEALAADSRDAFVACDEGSWLAIRKISLDDGEMSLIARRRYATPALTIDERYVYFTDPLAGVILRVRK